MPAAPRAPRLVARPVRSFPPPLPTEPLVVAAPPAALEPEGSKWATTLLPALSSLGVVGFAVASGSALYLLLGVGMAVLAVGATVGMRLASSRARRRRQDAARDRYSAHLDRRREELAELAARQRRALATEHPDPDSWSDVVDGPRLWERRPGDDDFLAVRVGRGRRALAGGVRCEPAPPGADEESDLRDEADLLVALHAHLDDVPLAVDLRGMPSLGFAGPAAHVWPAVRAVLLGLAVTHAPGEVSVAGLVPDEEADWLARLPHTCLSAADLPELARGVADRAPAPEAGRWPSRTAGSGAGHSGLVVVLTASACTEHPGLLTAWSQRTDLTCLVVAADDEVLPPWLRGLATLDPEGLTVRYADGSPSLVVARPDAVGLVQARETAETLAGLRPADVVAAGRPGPVRLRPLLVETLEPGPTGAPGTLAVPLGRDATGRRLVLDLAEAAQGGSGPHGLLVGATGSGKSELLRTVIAGLVHRLGPAELGLVCWDFKGGAAVQPFAGLPHVRGTVTNLEAEPALLDRADRSLRAEMRRRQQLLRDAGVDSVADYRRAPAAALAPLPTLVLVVDEFSELLAAAPDLLDLFVSLGRLGRSLGIHLLLASQRLDEGRLRGLESHLRYRICLRTFSAADSTAVLGTDAASRLPAVPGSGLLAVDGHLTRFDAALADDLAALVAEVALRVEGAPVPDRTLWQPPLPGELASAPPAAPPARDGGLRVDVGLVDRPDRQCREPLTVDLAAGHLAVVGGPRTGRSTTAAAVVAQLAAATHPRALQVHVLTDGAPPLTDLARLPHVGTVAAIDDREQVAAVVETLHGLCRARAGVAPPGADLGAVVLVVDGWGRLRRADEAAAETVMELAATGRGRGVHLIVTGTTWSEFRSGLNEHLATRWELRLTDPYESEHGKARAATLPGLPGRLLTAAGHEAQVARPTVTETPDGTPTVRAPALRPLPTTVDLTPLRHPGAVCLGIGGGLHEPVLVDLARPGDHLLVVGDGGSGRSTALRTVLAQLDAGRVDLWVLDRRRSLHDAVPPGARYAANPLAMAAALDDLATRLRMRMPGDDRTPPSPPHPMSVTPPPTQVLVVDDYDLLPAGGLSGGLSGGLGPLTELLPFADEIGLAVVLARRSGARAAYDPAWQSLVETGAAGLVLSGDPLDGAPFPGVRPRPLPPGRGALVRRSSTPLLIQVAEHRSAASETSGSASAKRGRVETAPASAAPAITSADAAELDERSCGRTGAAASTDRSDR